MDSDSWDAPTELIRTPPSLRRQHPRPASALNFASDTISLLPPLPLSQSLAPAHSPVYTSTQVPPSRQPPTRTDFQALTVTTLPHLPPLAPASSLPSPAVPAANHLASSDPPLPPPSSPTISPSRPLPDAPPRRLKRRYWEMETFNPADIPSKYTGGAVCAQPASSSSTSMLQWNTQNCDARTKPSHVRENWVRSYACQNCRRRKLKCDKNVPCAACVTRNEARECASEAGVLLPETSLDPHRNIEHRLDRLESLLAKIVQRSHTQGVAVPSQPLGTRLVEPRTNLSSSRHVGGSSGQNVLEQTNSRDRPSRTDRRLAPKAPAIITLMRPDASPAASKMVRGAILREALDLYPDIEAVRTCCATYFKEAEAVQPVVDETKFWRHFTKHEAFVRRARDKEIVWSESLRQETTFLALVLSVMVVGLINSLDPQLFCHFRDRHETPVSKFLNMVIRLLHVLDFHERPTLDTIRVGIVAYHSMFQSCTSWASDVFISVLTQDAIRLDLQKDPPPDCPTDEFFDRINIWVGALLLECFSTVKVLLKNNFELVRLAMGSLRRDGMGPEESFTYTLSLQARLDDLHQQKPPRLKKALDDPYSESQRFVTAFVIGRSMQLWLEMFLHGRYYARGWTESKYSISRVIFYRAAVSFVATFLDFWNSLYQRVENIQDLNPATLGETVPGLMFRVSPLSRTAYSLLIQLERHTHLMRAYPHMVTDAERALQDQSDRLVREMHELRRRFHPSFTFGESRRRDLSATAVTDQNIGEHPPHRDLQPEAGLSSPFVIPVEPMDSPPELLPDANLGMLLQVPDLEPMFGNPCDNFNSRPMTFEELLSAI